MKYAYKILLIFTFFFFSFAAHAQWFNDDMGAITSGSAPCPWVNTTGACNPAGGVNQGVCATGSNGGPVWLVGTAGGSYCWAANSAGNTACTFTYTVAITGTATISSVTFQARASSTGALSISTFTINGTSKTPSPATITSSFALITVTVSPAITVTNTNLTIVIGCTGASSTSTNWANRIDDFKIFGTAPVPVELAEFSVKASPVGVLLNWETATEHDNAYFSIQRSTDGIEYEEIAKVEGAGNSSTAQYYQYTDKNPLPGLNYYRLGQVDENGKQEYSPVRSLRFGLQNGISIAPNPVLEGSSGAIRLESEQEGEIKISLFNSLGQVILQKQFTAEKGGNTLDLDLSGIPKGAYSLQAETDSRRFTTQKLLIN